MFAVLWSLQLRSQVQMDKKEIGNILDSWHRAAGIADFDAYFNLMTSDAVFIGTDASENWQVEEFVGYPDEIMSRLRGAKKGVWGLENSALCIVSRDSQ